MPNKLTLGSLFDGIGGWQLAAVHAGVLPVWSSEIDPFCCAVTKRRFPGTQQLGDITQIDGKDIAPVDIVCAGSPCQDLSVAGKREGLEGARSGLFHRAVGIVRRMRESTGGKHPRFFVWENVPGAFSSNKGADFGAVLGAISSCEIPVPRDGKWANAGMVECEECQIAWRVLDAQYFGVPQRRKRIFLVADFGAGERRAGEILFVEEGLPRDPSESGEAGQGAAAGAGSGIEGAGRAFQCTGHGWWNESPIAEAIRTPAGGDSMKANLVSFAANQRDEVGDLGGKAGSLQAQPGIKQQTFVAAGFSVDASAADGQPVLNDMAPPMRTKTRLGVYAAGFKAAQSKAGGLGYEVERAATLQAAHSGMEPTVAVYPIEGNGARESHHGQGWSDDSKMYTLNTTEQHAVCVGNGQTNQSMSEKAGALNTMHDQQCVMAVDCRNGRETEINGTLQAKESGVSYNLQNVVRTKRIRRLTPTECERLQGLPDGFTLIDDKTCSDSARYKALGNGMAQPCADLVIRGIVREAAHGEK